MPLLLLECTDCSALIERSPSDFDVKCPNCGRWMFAYPTFFDAHGAAARNILPTQIQSGEVVPGIERQSLDGTRYFLPREE